MTDRRDFVLGALAGMGTLIPPRLARGVLAPSVVAVPTVFHAHPDGHLTLVRFYAHDIQAPAGRLRVYDSARRLLGTAGVLPSGDGLYGELWLPLERPITVTSALEYPGRRGPLRTTHHLAPTMRWTLFWIAPAAPDAIRTALQDLPPVVRAAAAAAYPSAGVGADPFVPDSTSVDEVTALRMGAPALEIGRAFGIPISATALISANAIDSAAITALSGSGVTAIVRSMDAAPDAAWIGTATGSRLLALAMPADADSAALGFTQNPDVMVGRIEARLAEALPLFQGNPVSHGRTTSRTGSSSSHLTADAVIVDDRLADDVLRRAGNAREWNRRFAFPKIQPADPAAISALATRAKERGSGIPMEFIDTEDRPIHPSMDTAALVTARQASRRRSASAAIAPLTALIGGGPRSLDEPRSLLSALGPHLDTAVPGVLVFNPTPFPRSDVARFPDGIDRVVTDVPPWGHAFISSAGTSSDGVSDRELSERTLVGACGRVRLDPDSGAIASLVDADGREWVRRGSEGLNALAGARLGRVSRGSALAGGVRLVAERSVPGFGVVQSTITVYDGLPWLDVENAASGADDPQVSTAFGFEAQGATVTWDEPLARRSAVAPLGEETHLRFVTLETDRGTVLFTAPDAPTFSVGPEGTLTAQALPARARYRVGMLSGRTLPTDGPRFGRGVEPMITAEAEGRPGGPLARFGPVVLLDQPGAAILAILPDEDGLLVFVQDLVGAGRYVTLGYGTIAFTDAEAVDFLGRGVGVSTQLVSDGAVFHLPASGVTALKLAGLRLNT